MANIPTPDVAKGTAAGAKQGRSADEFHSGPFHDIRDFGAAMDGSTDDSAAIMKALQESASTGGAAYIPKGTAFASGWSAVDFKQSMNGATLVGEGADSVIKGDSAPIGFFDSDHRNVTLANFRIDATSASRGIKTPNMGQGPGTGANIVFENLWVHGAENVNIKFALRSGGDPIASMKNLSIWGTKKWHGVGLQNQGGYVNVSNLLAWDCGTSGSSTNGKGIDCSGEYARVENFLFVNNVRGTKTTDDNIRTVYRNGAILNSDRLGFYASNSSPSGEVVLDNVLCRASGWEGFSFRANDYHIPSRIWAIDNCQTGDGHTNGGIEYAYGASIEASEIQVGGTQNDYPGVNNTTEDAGGTVETLVASENSGGTFGSRGDVSYGSVDNSSCEVPPIEEIVGTASQSAKVRYHDGTGWQDAQTRYHDGEQFQDVTVTQLDSS